MQKNTLLSLLVASGLMVSFTGCNDTKGDIHYCNVGDYAIDDNTIGMNIKTPEGEGPFPALLFVHGGYWSQGDLSSYNAEIKEAAQKGYVAATIDYRLTKEKNADGTVKYPWDAQLEDTKCAVRYLRAHAGQYGIDTTNIGIAGFSAGAHLSLMTGFTPNIERFEQEGDWKEFSSSVNAVVSFSGPTDLTTVYDISTPKAAAQKAAKDLMGGTPSEKPAMYLDGSPIEYITKAQTPVLFIHGKKDTIVPPSQITLMSNALDEINHAEHPTLIYEEAGHGWSGTIRKHANTQMFSFFDKHLKAKQDTTLSCSPYPSCQQ
jgi:dipeptidyl aminopeptidase/acylaminoacyl peptidase